MENKAHFIEMFNKHVWREGLLKALVQPCGEANVRQLKRAQVRLLFSEMPDNQQQAVIMDNVRASMSGFFQQAPSIAITSSHVSFNNAGRREMAALANMQCRRGGYNKPIPRTQPSGEAIYFRYA